MIGKSTLLWVVLACSASVVLYQTSYKAQTQERELARIKQAIRHERDNIQAWNAEWSMLNHPARLEQLAKTYLLLQPAKAEQIVRLDDIPMKGTERPVPTSPVPARKPQSPHAPGPSLQPKNDDGAASRRVASANDRAPSAPAPLMVNYGVQR
jgi:hypothetical protein